MSKADYMEKYYPNYQQSEPVIEPEPEPEPEPSLVQQAVSQIEKKKRAIIRKKK